MKINIASKEIIHLIGIGGIGMSGLAQIMKNMGFVVQGSDLTRNKNTDRLMTSGIKVTFSHNKKNIKKATLVVISSAIKKNNPELIAAKHKNGSASQALQKFFEFVKPRRVFLSVRSDNEIAKKFYIKNNMKLVGKTTWAKGTLQGEVYLYDR